MTTGLRSVAVAVALAAIVDPAFSVQRSPAPIVDVRLGVGLASDPRAIEIRERILTFSDAGGAGRERAGPPSAVVLIDPSPDTYEGLPEGLPVSVVELERRPEQAVRIRRVAAPAAVLPGQSAVVAAELEASGLAGQAAVVTLEHRGVELARVKVVWSDGGRQTAELAYAPPDAGVHELRVAVRPDGNSEGTAFDAVDVAIIAATRELRVMTYEPRPSWAAAFVRRVIESDPVFAPGSLARASRGMDVRAGAAPGRLNAEALLDFDAVVIGAPEALSAVEVEAVETFARVRGGAVVFLPDRRPSGPYLRLLPVDRFDEVLIETPLALEGASPPGLKASEFAIPRDVDPGASVIGSARLQARVRPVVVSWPLGAGRLVFSGALDAWRYRGDDQSGFARFWSGLIGDLAASAPRALNVTVHPALAAPGDPVTVRATIRQTEWDSRGTAIELPPLGAALIAADGGQQPIRMWPAPETGVFEGRMAAPEAGRFDVRVSAGRLTADAPLITAGGVHTAARPANEAVRAIVQATGGVAVEASDLNALHAHLRALRPSAVPVPVWPMRSPWWIVGFAGPLCAEWALRRRRGDR